MAITKDILSQYVDLKAEIKELRQKIEKLEKELENLTMHGTVKDTVSGGMGGTQHFVIEGIPMPEYNKKRLQLQARKARLVEMEDDLIDTVCMVEKFISEIPDSRMRRIINMRFIDGMKWDSVAAHIGGGNTQESVKQAFHRFMLKYDENCHDCHEKLW